MKGKLGFVFCLFLLMSCLAFARFGQPETKASNTLPVHNLSTGLNYTTIQEAIDANETLDGQTILVDEGTYYENIVVNKALSLIGANSESTVIDGNGTGNVVEIAASNVTLSRFTVTNSNNTQWYYGYAGILVDGLDVQIFSNRVTNNYKGISIHYPSIHTPGGCVVTGNDILNNSIGISLATASNTTITANTIADSSIQGIHSEFSENNTYFHNNLVRNNVQVINGGESGEWPNVWDNGNSSGGNFWSNYNGTDSDNDGFGETPCNVGPELAGNIDHYPLMGMFNSFNATTQYSVQTVCNSTISDFQFNGTAIAFNATGENGTTGFCRIYVPTALIKGTFTVFVNGTEVPYTLLPESDSTNSYLYFTYSHSTEQIIITPEFPSFLILPLFLITTLLLALIYKKRRQKPDETQ
jgi:parallel beta-helix repeat protein